VQEPRKRPFDDPSVTSQSLARLHAAPSDPWEDPTLSQCAPRQVGESYPLFACSLVGRLRGASWCPDRPTNGWTASTRRLQQFESYTLAAVSWTAEGIPCRSTMTSYLLPACRVGRAWPRVVTAALGANADAVHAGTAPVDRVQVAQPVEHGLVHRGPDTQLLPLAQTTPAAHAAAAAQVLREISPSQPMPQDEQDAAERGAVRRSRWSAEVAAWFGREKRFGCFPEILADGICAAHHRA
jgi:hypothetical protein